MKKYIIIIALTGILCSVWAAGTKEEYGTISVSGTGTVTMKSDAASILMTVSTINQDPSLAAEENAQKMTAVQNAVSVLGINKEDISTQDYSVYEDYRYTKDDPQRKPDYRVSNTITIIVHNISLVNVVIDAGLKAGANQLSQLSFFSTKTDEAYDNARDLAIQDAQRKAQKLALGTGRKLGQVIKIEEGYTSSPRNSLYKTDMAMAQGTPTPVSPEDDTITLTYNFVFSLY